MSSDKPMGDDTHRFVEQHYSPEHLEELKATARRLAADKAAQVDASALVLEAWLKAARNHRQLRDPEHFNAWMKRIVVHEVLARLRLESCRRTRTVGQDRLRELPDPRAQECAPEAEEEKARAKAYLARLLALLPEADRDVLCVSRLQGLPDGKAAELLGISQVALRQRRSRAMQRLKELARRYPDGAEP
jgi:RNA polymerase sigma factor (sigma-70 family)